MNYILELFTIKELIIIGAVIGSLIILAIILTIWDVAVRKRKENQEFDEAFENFDKNETKEIKEEIQNEVIKETIETLQIDEPIPLKKKEVVEEIETLDIDSIMSNKQEEKIESLIMDIEENIPEKELNTQEKARLELQEIEENLKNTKSLEDTLYDLEAIEEENAIISYQELLETTREMNVVNADSGDEPISLKEILNMYDEPVGIQNNQMDVNEEMSKTAIADAYKGDFTSSPYLSPIVGFENEISSSVTDLAEIQLENTANLEKLDKEIRKTNEFLTILNDLKKNLD